MRFSTFTIAVALSGALATAALNINTNSMYARQMPAESSIPAACTSACKSSVDFSDSCGGGRNTSAICLKACEQSTFNEFTGCFQCVADKTEGLSEGEKGLIAFSLEQLKEDCQKEVKSTLTGGVTLAAETSAATSGASSTVTLGKPTSAALSGSASASVSASASSAASQAASVTSAAASAGSAAAASASPSGGAGSGAGPVVSLAGGLVALVGVAAGIVVIT